jgi:uncharacterized protein (DUF2062 family)
MRRWFRRLLPNHEAIHTNRWLAPFANTLLHPRLWHLNRHSAAGGIAAGLFCGLIPGPLQMVGAAICAVLFRVNLPLALLTTVYTNPLTIIPLYMAAFTIGQWVLGSDGRFHSPPEMNGLSPLEWGRALGEWMIGLGAPLALGLLLLASGLALLGYGAVRFAWRVHLVRRWRQRQNRTCR